MTDHGAETGAGRRYFIGQHAYAAPAQDSALYIVSTPIGNLGDITLRALETLAAADVVACEDTRVTATLMQRFGLKAPLLPYHEHNAERQRPRLLAALAEGQVVALVSDAGTPLVSDPGYRLVRDVLAAGHRVVPIPGASAPLAGLVASGLPTDTLLFAGFLPQKAGARLRRLSELAPMPATLAFFESPHRLAASLAAMAEALGPREAVVARELTKRFETFQRGTLAELAAFYADNPPKGEIVVLVGPPAPQAPAEDADDVEALLRDALARQPVAAAAKEIARRTGRDRTEIYRLALALKAEAGESDAVPGMDAPDT
ncbi:16S rRNA (cytidine(1402)-2'-O)-methyltransferase [Microvirga tunisiensis]|uniref:Ribosomal RNA small subunit methyltransferase I n=2 Tax=Pannonibacter tanglangensis TaxID=2750084 RepID=A0A7X5JB44_9HYPH|nr:MULTISPECIES: 16S rRNA (cytidine(1402)-2'-O)-methyltransferase [unclassified Pannonibacter]NBN65687.1 16S rRNA (cytidine(1402)-2'-O)-methyltransferase [Pannonibacter sp. XCT-34]NBN80086.1 16S rRNA (cytidine(1402)-2'-O)-methyltransferase [Pannonibacter sp. XCT-53]